MALRAFYFIRVLTKALTCYYINRSQRHLLVAIENNRFGGPNHCRLRSQEIFEIGSFIPAWLYADLFLSTIGNLKQSKILFPWQNGRLYWLPRRLALQLKTSSVFLVSYKSLHLVLFSQVQPATAKSLIRLPDYSVVDWITHYML